MKLKVGNRLFAQNSSCEVVVVRSSQVDAALMCAGAEMVTSPLNRDRSADGPLLELGKRYSDDGSGVEVLCIKAGVGPLTLEGRPLERKSAKLLPASD